MPAPKVIEIGTVFARLTTIGIGSKTDYLICRCTCGTEKQVRKDHLRYGKILSCGCLHKEKSSARAHILHKANITHGLTDAPIHRIWFAMRSRCQNPKNIAFKDYGGRGIRLCERWQKFENFVEDMGLPPAQHTIERINNNGHYEKKNCKWATRQEQGNNRRDNRRINLDGITKTIAQWSRETGIHQNTITNRMEHGHPPEIILSSDRVRHTQSTILSADDVRTIRAAIGTPKTILAKRYGVSVPNIYAILKRRSWKHV